MRAVTARRSGGPEELALEERPRPAPGSGEVLLRVKAAALNRADVLQRRGHYPPPPGVTDVLGLEAAGVVESVGPGVSRWKPGDRAMALVPGGAQAEFALAHQGLLMPVPAGLSDEQAAAVPEVFLTAYNALVLIGGLSAGQSALIHAGASGLGTAAIQVAKALGAAAYATAGSAAKAEACRALGADGVALYKEEDFAEKVLGWTGGRGVDVLLDVAGADAFSKNMDAVAEGGRWVVLGFLGGRRARDLDLARLLFKRVRIQGSALRGRPSVENVRLVEAFSAWALPLFAAGRLKPVIDQVLPWEEVADAHRRMEANLNVGKIVLRVA